MDELTKAVLKTDFTAFFHKVVNTVEPDLKYEYNWHLGLICEYLMACYRGEIRRLIINIAPKHLKSSAASIAFPAWLLAHNPGAKIMCASYGQSLSLKLSSKCRKVIESSWYKELFPNTLLDNKKNTESLFLTTMGGYREATSFGGAATGGGGHMLIVDDPTNAEEATSETEREKANLWFDETFVSRLDNRKTGCILVIMQRLHENDLTGHLLNKGGWEHLCLPLIAEKDEILEKGVIRKSRITGEFLQPERIGEAEVIELKREMGPDAFAGQYQQRPTPKGGNVFKKDWIQYYDKLSFSSMNKYMFIDPANSKSNKSDYTAIIILGTGEDKNYYILDMIRDRINIKERIDLIIHLHKKYNPLNVGYQINGTESEPLQLKMEMERLNYRFGVEEIRNNNPKFNRITRLQPPFADKKIYLPRVLYKTNYQGITFDVIDQFIHKELEAYPNGLHDDLLDALSMIFDMNIIFPGGTNYNYDRLYNNDQWSRL